MKSDPKKKRDPVSILFVTVLLGTFLLFLLLPKAERSENEKRELSRFPAFSLSSVTSGEFTEGLEAWVNDHFPFRDFFVGVNACWELWTGRNGVSGVYQGKDGYLITAPGEYSLEQTQTNVERFARFARSSGLPALLMAVPTKGAVLTEEMPPVHGEFHDEEIFETAVSAAQAEGLDFLDLRPVFEEQKGQTQLYYRTDHHLTSAGSLVMYRAFCRHMGLEEAQFSLSRTSGGFYGTAYSRSGLWLTRPDTLEIWTSTAPGEYEVVIDDGNGVRTSDSLYFPEHLEDMDQYPVFLDGNHSVVTVRNRECRNGRRLLLVKDSFAHCFATFAIENFEEICMVDLRYFRGSVSGLAEQEGLNQILFLYGAENLASSTDTAWLSFAATGGN